MLDEEKLFRELDYKAVRSSGPGGQHANKTSTKVELSFALETSQVLSEAQKRRVREKLASRITKGGLLRMSSEDSRSQHTNKEIVTQTFLFELKEALKRPKKRRKTKPTRASKIKRLKEKKRISEIKKNRKDPLK